MLLRATWCSLTGVRLAASLGTIVLALVLWLGGPARANDCPPPDAFNDSTIPGCPTDHPDPNAPIDDGVPPTMMEPPTVDAEGNPIPFVEEITAPPVAPTLTDQDPD
jgi:hypothetical protein